MDDSKPVNYWEYIRVEELLGLQGGLEDDDRNLTNDEVLFITVHQVFELWFKLVRRELVALRDLFDSDPVAEQELSSAVRGIGRICAVLRRCVDHFEVMETLTTRDYLGFRDKLMPASGFQSAQLRQIEILLGLPDEDRIPLGGEESWIKALRSHDGSESSALRRVLKQQVDTPSLRAAAEEWLLRTPIDGRTLADDPDGKHLARFVTAVLTSQAKEVDKTCALAQQRAQSDGERERLAARYEAEKEALDKFLRPTEEEGGLRLSRIRSAMFFILSYRELPLLAWPREVLDGLIELEQLFVIFRQRHARMVERVIGKRTGTGGSSGVDYLDETALKYRIFRDLWAVRSHQMRQVANPPLERPEFYGFRNG